MRSFQFNIDATREPKVTIREPMGDFIENVSIEDAERLLEGLTEAISRMRKIRDALKGTRAL